MRALAIGFLSVLLACCGGGGSGGGSTPPPPPPPVNQAPTITSLNFAGSEDHDLTGAMAATDPEGTAVTFTHTTEPTYGQLTSFTANGAFTYHPNPNFAGSDSFTVRATDAANAQTTATITIQVANGDDDAPILKTDIIKTTGQNPVVDVLANDLEPDGETMTLALEGNPDFGSAMVVNGKIRFSLPDGFKGFNRFKYRAEDGAGQGGVVNAVIFVDSEHSRLVYFSTTAATHGWGNVYIDDFVSTRRMTDIETTYAVDGLYPYTFDSGGIGRNIIVEYKLDSRYSNVNGLEVIATDGSSPPRRLTARPTGIGDAYALASDLSPDNHWAVFRHRPSTGGDHYFLADLDPNGVNTELTLPAGASSIPQDYAILFAPDSLFFYAPIDFDFPDGKRGSAIYRYSVAAPAAAPQLVSPAAQADVSVDITRLSPDGARILFTENHAGELASRPRVVTVATPTAPITLSHAFGTNERISGFIHTNAAFSRVYYPTEDGVDPNYTFRLYGADTATAGSASLITNLPADAWRPEVWELSPDETSFLFTTPVLVSGQRYRQANTIALTPGAQPQVIGPPLQWLDQYRFIDDGRSVLYGDGINIYSVSSTTGLNPHIVAFFATSGYGLSPDRTYLATSFSNSQTIPVSNHLWIANTAATSSSWQVEFSGVGDATAFASTWGFIPAPP